MRNENAVRPLGLLPDIKHDGAVDNTREMSTRTARATAKEYLSQISLGRHPKEAQHKTE
jgi:hypothetical protein